jgi:hypothetical protein
VLHFPPVAQHLRCQRRWWLLLSRRQQLYMTCIMDTITMKKNYIFGATEENNAHFVLNKERGSTLISKLCKRKLKLCIMYTTQVEVETEPVRPGGFLIYHLRLPRSQIYILFFQKYKNLFLFKMFFVKSMYVKKKKGKSKLRKMRRE